MNFSIFLPHFFTMDTKLLQEVFIKGSPMLLRRLLSYLTPKEIVYMLQLYHRIKVSNPDKKCIIFKYVLRCHPSYEIISKAGPITNYSKATIISQIWKQHSNLCINCFIYPYYEWMYSSSISNQYPHISILCTGCARRHWDRLTKNESRKIPFEDLLISNYSCSPLLQPVTSCKQCLTSEVANWPPVWKNAFPPLNHYCFQCAYYLYPFHIVATTEVKSDKLVPNRNQMFYAPTLKQGNTKFRLILPRVLITDIPSDSETNKSKKRKRQNSDVDDVLATIGNLSSNRKTSDSTSFSDSSSLRNPESLRRSSRIREHRLVSQ